MNRPDFTEAYGLGHGYGGCAMIKLNILDMNHFLEMVNTCREAVFLIRPNGSREKINGGYAVQNELQRQYAENKKYLKISLDIPDPEDYMRVVSYYAGNY